MKKIKLLVLVCAFVFSFSACDNTKEEEPNLQKNENNYDEMVENNEISMELPVTSVYAKKDEELPVVVFTGRVEFGTIKNTDSIYIVLEDGTEIKASVYKLEQYRKNPTEASSGDNVGVVLKDINIDDVRTAVKIVIK